MQIETRREADVTILKPLESAVDSANAPEFKRHLRDAIATGSDLVVIDAVEVDFMDSAGLGALIGSLKALEGRGEIAISGASESVEQLLKTTGLDRLFKVFSTPEDAIATLSR